MGTVVVTGATGGLGRVLVSRLQQGGTRVVAVDRSTLLAPAAWSELLGRLEGEDAAPEGAVLVAGSWDGGKKLHEDTGDAVWRSMLQSNLETARVALQALLPGMVTRKQGSIVVVGSRAAERPWESAG